MTVISDVEGEKVRSSAYAVELRAAAPLMRAIKNGLVAAAPSYEPVKSICAVQIHFDGTELEIQSTDRYLALFEQVAGVDDAEDAPTSDPFKLLLPSEACKQAMVFLKSVPKNHPVTLTWEPLNEYEWAEGNLRLSSYDSSVTLKAAYNDSVPRLRALVPRPDLVTPTEVMGFRRSIIQSIGKIEADAKDPIVKVTLFGSAKSQRVDWPDERRTLLVMSARIVEDASEWGVPGL